MTIEEIYSRYEKIIPDFKEFLEILHQPQRISIRLNTIKCRKETILNLFKDYELIPLKFYEDGYIVKNGFGIGNHYLHQLGLIYVQEIASMIPALILEPKPGEVILDLCASPGSKTTQISQLMGNKGLLIANEIDYKRLSSLIHNVKKCGLLNEVLISIPGEKIGDVLPNYFDKILLDAPCSAEGTIRKSKKVLYHWGIKNIQKMARIQKGLIVSAFRALKPGGIMVYSTCTIAPEENEGVVDYLLKKFPEAEVLPINLNGFKFRPGVTNWEKENYDPRVKNCARILPQDNDTAPFFLTKITKLGLPQMRPGYHGRIEYQNKIIDMLNRQYELPDNRFSDFAVFQRGDKYFISTPEAYAFIEIPAIRKGLEVGRVYGSNLKPDNDFVQIFALGAKKNTVELKDWELKRILRGESIKKQNDLGEFIIFTFKGFPVSVGHVNNDEIKSTVKRARRIKED
ncbi:MAG: NOL1/NOP2/sun family putative RNA methylase [candidate division WOR-3 bacterium]|nr:NOL1/NOP2/sun family putative RNA methylase [candidate division WOR-3 bacterium]